MQVHEARPPPPTITGSSISGRARNGILARLGCHGARCLKGHIAPMTGVNAMHGVGCIDRIRTREPTRGARREGQDGRRDPLGIQARPLPLPQAVGRIESFPRRCIRRGGYGAVVHSRRVPGCRWGWLDAHGVRVREARRAARDALLRLGRRPISFYLHHRAGLFALLVMVMARGGGVCVLLCTGMWLKGGMGAKGRACKGRTSRRHPRRPRCCCTPSGPKGGQGGKACVCVVAVFALSD
jgi:hypothetical protein